MAYPEVPELIPFEPQWSPNLMDGGSYHEQLVKIMEYLRRLGAYIDDQIANVEGGGSTGEGGLAPQNILGIDPVETSVDDEDIIIWLNNVYRPGDSYTIDSPTWMFGSITSVNDVQMVVYFTLPYLIPGTIDPSVNTIYVEYVTYPTIYLTDVNENKIVSFQINVDSSSLSHRFPFYKHYGFAGGWRYNKTEESEWDSEIGEWDESDIGSHAAICFPESVTLVFE